MEKEDFIEQKKEVFMTVSRVVWELKTLWMLG
jgi:hypothetical protein